MLCSAPSPNTISLQKNWIAEKFAIAGAPVGLVKILVDGSTAPPAGTYPVTEYDLVTVAGQNNTVGQRSISWRSADPVP